MIDSPLALLRSLVPSLINLRILDAGSGDGSLAKLLTAEGAKVVGIDPNPEAVTRARALVPQATFDCGVAEQPPYGNSSFDIVVFVNALHHVPVNSMGQALLEASRVLVPNGLLVVVEPLPNGSFFDALRLIEDETEVRMAAQAALEKAVLTGQLRPIRSIRYVRRETFDGVERFLDRIVAVDPARALAARSRYADVVKAVNNVAERLADGRFALDQPIKADILTKAVAS